VVIFTPRPLYFREGISVPIEDEARWVSEPAWELWIREKFVFQIVWAVAWSLYRLRCSAYVNCTEPLESV